MTYELQHGQGSGIVVTDGQPGDQVLLETTGPKYYEWSPKAGRRALDLELRARIVESSAVVGTSPLIRWYLEIGHGDQSWTLPARPLTIVSGTFSDAPILPARGLLLRLSARQLKIWFQGGTVLGGAALARSKIAVSVQPSTQTACCAADWKTQHIDPAVLPPPPHVAPFPMGAQEFRVRHPFTSVPFAAAACAVIYTGIAGQLFGPVDVFTGGLGDWTPIPPFAASLLPSVAAQVSYR